MEGVVNFACRSCGSTDIAPVLSLGTMALANSYVRRENADQPEPAHPLDLVRCQACTLVQITCTVPPEVLFRDYLYLSSYSTTMLRHAETVATRLIAELGLGKQSRVVEVASNDGYLLQYYRRAGVEVLGIEPARNVAEIAIAHGVPSIAEFFDATLATRLRSEGVAANVLHANNVLAHVAGLNAFVEGFRVILAQDGVVVSESPYLTDFLRKTEFDTIYHEHLCYYSLTALTRLFERHGLVIVDCERLPIHGGSLRIFARHSGSSQPSERVRALLAEEQAWGVDTDDPYRTFAERVANVTSELTTRIRGLRAEGKRVCGYGAAAKATVMLNACGLGENDISFVCDKSPLKQGRLMPGVRIPVVAPGHLAASDADYCVIFAWNVADEVRREQEAFTARGGRFILPLPRPEVIP